MRKFEKHSWIAMNMNSFETKEIFYDNNEDDTASLESSMEEKFKITEVLKEKLKDLPEVLEMIVKLQKLIAKQRKRIKKLKTKLKIKLKTRDVATQTDDSEVKTECKTISEEITEAASMALEKTGFVYEETSGMYYDYNTGYYYNAEYGLYYDGNTGTYMSYNQEKKTYEFHSQVEVKPVVISADAKYKNRETKRKKNRDYEQASKRKKMALDSDLEEGECSDSSCNESVKDLPKSSDEDQVDEAGNQWPPCMRIIIEETSIPKLKVGSLHVVTYEGGTIGREGEHSLLIPDINISKHHLKLHFDKATGKYFLTDLGSRNGTVLNGKRMSASKQESEAFEVPHSSRIQLGTTILLCHIHPGNQTCGHCEPGLIQKSEKKEITYNKTKQHKNELKQLKKKFGIGPSSKQESNLASGYTDRAQVRRETVGSQNPNEKTEMASVNESISSKNKGFKLLSKMGWSEGQTLGKNNQGILEPINQISNTGTTGLGSTSVTINTEIDSVVKNKVQNWTKAQERFQKIASNPTTSPIFEDFLD